MTSSVTNNMQSGEKLQKLRREFLTEFTGSAGTAVVGGDAGAALWTDGRYFLQAAEELDASHWKLMKSGTTGCPSIAEYIRDSKEGTYVGIDPLLHTIDSYRTIERTIRKHGKTVRFVSPNPVDKVWGAARPQPPRSPIRVHKLENAGKTVAEKLKEVRAKLRDCEGLAERGLDVSVDTGKVSIAIYNCIHDTNKKYGTGSIIEMDSPISIMKAVKNEAEVKGMKEAHVQDAVAVIETLCWVSQKETIEKGVNEVDIDEYLTGRRALRNGFIEPSFPTIAGGQYEYGTTDVTRTIHVGNPTPLQKRAFTRVLQGHINLATAVFPDRTPGAYLDTLARFPLWKDGLIYRHGTGHGVGAALNVHEGPISISARINEQPLLANMVVSNEPGVYLNGRFGVRIENLVVIEDAADAGDAVAAAAAGGADDIAEDMGKFLKFSDLTLIPIQHSLIDMEIQDAKVSEWLRDATKPLPSKA